MTLRAQRALLIAICVVLLAAAAALIAVALNSEITFYKTPKDIAAALAKNNTLIGQHLRIGGFVERQSVKRQGTEITFSVTDFSKKISVRYNGILPDLFREGQGVIAEGILIAPDILRADKIFAKHDENYRPPNLPENYP